MLVSVRLTRASKSRSSSVSKASPLILHRRMFVRCTQSYGVHIYALSVYVYALLVLCSPKKLT